MGGGIGKDNPAEKQHQTIEDPDRGGVPVLGGTP